jgi:lactate 2-monooxygenase
MVRDGLEHQSAIYAAGASVPQITAEDWRRAAKRKLDSKAYGYIAGGAGSEATMRANRQAFVRRRLRPRMLRGVAERDISVEVLGTRSPAPFLLAPIGALTIAHPEGELAAARAAAGCAVPFVLSSVASSSIEQVAEAMGESPRWLQLYWTSAEGVARSFVQRAEAAGYSAIVVTLDTPALGWRPRDLREGYLPFRQGHGCGLFFSDPVFCERLARPPQEDVEAAIAGLLESYRNLALGWEDIEALRTWTSLPVLVKGVLTAEDARLALEHGVDGIVVSNHGGRQVDGAVASLDALAEVRATVGPGYPLLVDSGIRTGADVLKALCAGADAVLLGRPYAFALAAAGQEGVATVIRDLASETDITLALLGARSARDLDGAWLDG